MMKVNSQHGCSQTAYVMSMTVVPKFNLAEIDCGVLTGPSSSGQGLEPGRLSDSSAKMAQN